MYSFWFCRISTHFRLSHFLLVAFYINFLVRVCVFRIFLCFFLWLFCHRLRCLSLNWNGSKCFVRDRKKRVCLLVVSYGVRDLFIPNTERDIKIKSKINFYCAIDQCARMDVFDRIPSHWVSMCDDDSIYTDKQRKR